MNDRPVMRVKPIIVGLPLSLVLWIALLGFLAVARNALGAHPNAMPQRTPKSGEVAVPGITGTKGGPSEQFEMNMQIAGTKKAVAIKEVRFGDRQWPTGSGR